MKKINWYQFAFPVFVFATSILAFFKQNYGAAFLFLVVSIVLSVLLVIQEMEDGKE
jgi:hypothetical protein